MNRLFGPTIPIITVVVAVVLIALLCYVASVHKPTYPAEPFGGGGGGGWADPSNSGMILAPGGRISMKSIPWWIGWAVGEIVDWALQPIKDCITQGTCNQSGGPTGGGGGGGIPPQCSSGDFCTGGPMGPAAKKSLWNWFAFSEKPN